MKNNGILYAALILALCFTIPLATATVYDDFESGSLNATKWSNNGPPVVSSLYAHSGTYSLRTESDGANVFDVTSLLLSDLVPATGKTVISYWVYFNSSTGPGDDIAPFYLADDTSPIVALDGGYPTTDEWGYYLTGNPWVSTGVPSNAGDGNVVGTWLQVRVLVDNDANTFSLRFGNSTTATPGNLSVPSDIQELYLYPTVGGSPDVFWDDVEAWDYATEGWCGPSAPCPDVVVEPNVTTVTLISPADAVTVTETNQTFSFSFNSTNNTVMSCDLYVSNVSFDGGVLYDDFESVSIDLSKWSLSGIPGLWNVTAHSGAQSVKTTGTEEVSSINLNMSKTGRTVLSFWVYGDTLPDMNDVIVAVLTDDLTASCFFLDAGYPTPAEWGYSAFAPWVSTTVPSNSGRGNVNFTWTQIRVLVDNTLQTFSLRIGNTNTDDVTNVSWAGGCTNATQVKFSGTTSDNASWDDVTTWNFDTYGWGDFGTPFLVAQNASTENNTATTLANSTFFSAPPAAYNDQYNWYVMCADAMSSQRSFTLNITAPPAPPESTFVYLSSPANGSLVTSAAQAFSFYFDSTNSTALSCSLTVDATVIGTNASVTNYTVTTLSNATFLNGSANGTHTWFVGCGDNVSEVRDFTLNLSGPCVPNWSCSGYGSCLINDTELCNAVTDLNTCSESYGGDYSEFTPQSCTYVPAQPPQTNSDFVLSVFITILVLFILVGVLDTLMSRKSPEVERAFGYLYAGMALVGIVAALLLIL
jgi:hypothetical protein